MAVGGQLAAKMRSNVIPEVLYGTADETPTRQAVTPEYTTSRVPVRRVEPSYSPERSGQREYIRDVVESDDKF